MAAIKPHNFYIQPFIIYTSSLCINEFIAAKHQYSLFLSPPVNSPPQHRTALCRAHRPAAPVSVMLYARPSSQLAVVMEPAAPSTEPPDAAAILPPPPRHVRETQPMGR